MPQIATPLADLSPARQSRWVRRARALDEIAADLRDVALGRRRSPRRASDIIASIQEDLGKAIDNGAFHALRRDAFDRVLGHRPMNCRREVTPFSDDFGRLSHYEEAILRAVALERSTFKLRLIGKVVDDKNTPLIDASGRLASIETTAFGPTAWESRDPSEDLPDIETIPDPPQVDPERAAVQSPLPMTYSATNGEEVDYRASTRAIKTERWWSERYKEARDARRPLEGVVEVRVRADASPAVLVAVLGALGPLVEPLGEPLPLTCSTDADGGESFVVVFPQEKKS